MATPLKPRRLLPDEARKPDWQHTLAEVDGVVADVFRRGEFEYVWLRGEQPFRAYFRPRSDQNFLGSLEPGMRVILRGVLVPQSDSNDSPVPHELALRSSDDIVIGKWKDGRVGTVLALRPYGDFGAVVHTEKKTLPTGTIKSDYTPMLREIVKFFQTGVAPVSEEETMELFAFMDAAQKSKEQGGKPVKVKR